LREGSFDHTRWVEIKVLNYKFDWFGKEDLREAIEEELLKRPQIEKFVIEELSSVL